MQTRLLACAAGGLLGVALAASIRGDLGLTPTLAVVACASAGVAIGYVASILYDVFAGTGTNHLDSLK